MTGRECLLAALLCCGLQSAYGQSLPKLRLPGLANRSPAAAKESLPELRLSEFKAVTGTPFLVAALVRPDVPKGPLSASMSSYQSRIVNYVFFDLASDTAITLLPNNKSLIVSLEGLPNDSGKTRSDRDPLYLPEAQPPDVEKAQPVRWHAVEYVASDTDADGELTAQDGHSWGIADASGQGFVEVISNLGEVFSRTMVDPETLHIIHGSQASQVAVRVHLPSRKVTSAKPLPNFTTPGR